MDLWLQFVLLVPLSVGELALIGVLLGHRSARTVRATLPLAVSLGLIAIWASGLAAAFVGRPFSRALLFWWQRVATYAFPLAATPLFFATWAILHRRAPFPKSWYMVPVLGLAAAVILDPAVVPLHVPDWHIWGRVIPHQGWWRIVWTILWAAPTAVTWWMAVVRRPRRVGFRAENRIRYWTLALAISLVADGLVLTGRPLMAQCAGLIKLLAGVVMTTTLVTRPLPDTRRVLRLTAGALIRVLVAVLVFAGILWLGRWIERQWGDSTASHSLLAALAIASTGLYLLARFLARKVAGRLTARGQRDIRRITSDYERRIGHGLEIGQLAERLATMAQEGLDIDHITVATLHAGPAGELLIRPLLSRGCTMPRELLWLDSSPLVDHLVARRETLSAGDLETDLAFDALSHAERLGLSAWASELLIPIASDDDVLGLLAVGPKRSRDSYAVADVDLLEQLAAQTGPALAYARRTDRLARENEQAAARIREIEQAYRELRELDRLKSGLIGTLTHDLRVPFVAIDQTLAQFEGEAAVTRDWATQLGQSIGDLRRLVDHLIGFGTMVGKQGALQLQSVPLAPVVDEAILALEIMARARRVNVTSSIDDGLAPIIADRQRLTDAVYQLIHNAIKYNRAGGEVQVRCTSGQEWVTLEVQDTGCGIAPDQLRQLAMPGMPLPDGEERGVNGMGLGLALARYVARVHGGRLEIETELGLGSTFRLQLPTNGPGEGSDWQVSSDR